MVYAAPNVFMQEPEVISTAGWPCVGCIYPANTAVVGSAAWPSANLALFFPFVIANRRTYNRCVWNNGTVSGGQGNIDIGVYNLSGTRLGSLGNTAQGTSNTTTLATFGTPFTLDPGRYLMAMVCDSTDGFIRASVFVQGLRPLGCFEVASASPLPSSVTLAALTNGYVPLFGIGERTTL